MYTKYTKLQLALRSTYRMLCRDVHNNYAILFVVNLLISGPRSWFFSVVEVNRNHTFIHLLYTRSEPSSKLIFMKTNCSNNHVSHPASKVDRNTSSRQYSHKYRNGSFSSSIFTNKTLPSPKIFWTRITVHSLCLLVTVFLRAVHGCIVPLLSSAPSGTCWRCFRRFSVGVISGWGGGISVVLFSTRQKKYANTAK